MSLADFTLRARFVFPADGPVIENGTVQIVSDRIVAVSTAGTESEIDCGNSAILPGFVNAHTHLELSTIRAGGLSGNRFVEWLANVMAARRGHDATQISHAVSRGIDASIAAGTTLVGDISTSGRSWKELLRSPIRAVVFAELLGLKPERARETAEAARQFLEWTNPALPHQSPELHPSPHPSPLAARGEGGRRPGEGWPVNCQAKLTNPEGEAAASSGESDVPGGSMTGVTLGDGSTIDRLVHASPAPSPRRVTPSLSPHAPYSTDTGLYDLAADWSRRSATPICTHLAETLDELRLLRDRDGPLREFLMSIGAWDTQWTPAGAVPLDYLDATASRQADWILAHGNYLSDHEIERLAAQTRSGQRRSVVYCPRTHAYFGHAAHPYAKLMAAGLNVCLGTDSLASSPSLSTLDEMRFLYRRDRTIDGQTLLQMGTLSGARALNYERACGSLTPGKFADLAIVRLPDRSSSDPYQLLWDSTEPVIRTVIGGRTVFQLRGR